MHSERASNDYQIWYASSRACLRSCFDKPQVNGIERLPSAWLRTPSGTAATSHSHDQTTRIAKDKRTPEGDRNVKQVGTGTRKFPCCSRPLRMSGIRPQSLQDPQGILRVVDSDLRAQAVKISFYHCSKREGGVMCHVSRFALLVRLARWVVICSRRRWHPSARRPTRLPFSPESAPSSLWLRPTRKKSISLAPSVTTAASAPAHSGKHLTLCTPDGW